MSYLDSLLLGLLQGFTEFLPISSSGHLVIFQQILGYKQSLLAFDVFLHFGTLVAVILFYRKELWELTQAAFQPKANPESFRLLVMLFIASVPTALMGLLLKDYFEAQFSSLPVTGYTFIMTGLILLVAQKVKEGPRVITQINIVDSLLIGVAQGIAISPAISRSGTTVATGIFRGIKAKDAANFSFLLSIPAVLGANILEIHEVKNVSLDELKVFSVGILAAGVVGYLSIAFLLKLLQRKKIGMFGFYCVFLGLAILIFIYK